MIAVGVYILLAIAALNFKTLPFAWFLTLVWHTIPNLRQRPWSKVGGTLQEVDSNSRNPLFEPMSMKSFCPLTEMDHNLHKSNSTFFADVDISRAKVLFALISPALLGKGSNNILRILESEGHRGKFGVVLGAVHMSFKKEIKPYQSYDVESKITGWDQKWLVIETIFWRNGRKTFLGKAVSKFVFKKGRFTVAPERIFRSAGLIKDPISVPDLNSNMSTLETSLEKLIVTKSESESDWSSEMVEKKRTLGLQAYQTWLDFSSHVLENP